MAGVVLTAVVVTRASVVTCDSVITSCVVTVSKVHEKGSFRYLTITFASLLAVVKFAQI